MMKIPNQHGDTIVEVLVAAAILMSVLLGAYGVSQRSSQAVRSSQEQSEALQLLQGQVELTRSLALAQTDTVSGVYQASPTYFCIDTGNAAGPTMTGLPNLGSSLPLLASDDFAANYSSGATSPCLNAAGRYNLATTYDDSSKVFTFTVRWDRVGGGRKQERLAYRIHPGLAAAALPTAPLGNAALGQVQGPPSICVLNTPVPYPTCWMIAVDNKSVNPLGSLSTCSFDWGDGSPLETYAGNGPQCQFNFRFGPHTYPNNGSTPYMDAYVSTLTNYFVDPSVPPQTTTFSLIATPY